MGNFPTSSLAPSRRAEAGSCGWEAWVWDRFPVSSLGPSSLGTPFSWTWHSLSSAPLSLHGLRFPLPPPPARLCPGYERNCVPWWTHGPSPVIPANGRGADLGVSALPPFYPGQLALLTRPVERGQDSAGLWATVPGIVGATSPPSAPAPLPVPHQLCPSSWPFSLSSGTTFFPSPFLFSFFEIY